MDVKDLGLPIREPGEKPFLYLTGTIVRNKHGIQTNQETHMRPPENGWQSAHVLIDKGELVIWCDKLRFKFRAIGDDIECVKMGGVTVILDSKSADLIRCIESQVDGNLRKKPAITHKKHKK